MKSIDKYMYSVIVILNKNQGDFTHGTGKKSKSTVSQGMRDAMKKATTEMLVLFMLRQKPMYTYQIAQEVNRLTQGVLSYNTMYLAVYRLQENGFIEEAKKVLKMVEPAFTWESRHQDNAITISSEKNTSYLQLH